MKKIFFLILKTIYYFQTFFTGVSDPYVRCLHGQDKLFQSRAMPKTVNPSWDETFDVHIDNPFKAITLQV